MTAKTDIGNYVISTRFGNRRPIKVDEKISRPRDIKQAKQIIEDVFCSQPFGGWCDSERQSYFSDLGVAGTDSPEDVRRIINNLEKAKMVLFKDERAEMIDIDENTETKTGENVVALYADGGVIKKNPSPIGGTWAWCGVNSAGERVVENFGVVPATETRAVSNNHSEQIAITLALEAMPDGWSGTVFSDSQIALGRVFKNWRENNLPKNISERSRQAVARLGKIEIVLLQGHPTKADLENGIGKKRGYPVPIHNVWCDQACGLTSRNYLAKITNEW